MAISLSEFGAHVFINGRNLDACNDLTSVIIEKGGAASIRMAMMRGRKSTARSGI
jgi:hypothetical protein